MRKTLNLQQEQAIQHGNGPCMVLAGPGSGKTTVITKRIRFLICNKQIPPEQILVITFTRAAALEMEQRFCKLMKDSYYPVTFATFHSFFLHLLQLSVAHLKLDLISEREKHEILSEGLLKMGIPVEEQTLCIKYYLSNLKEAEKLSNPAIPPPLSEEQRTSLSLFYSGQKSRLGKVDFEDMEILCEQLLHDNPQFLAKIQEKYRYIMIDEFQDVNDIQFRIIKLLCKKHRNLFVVGDDDQSIYGFRGSKPNIMLELPNIYPDLTRIILNINYRSTPEIAEVSGRLIRHNQYRFQKEVRSVREKKENSVCISILNDRTELSQFLSTLVKSDSQTAIICRTNQELLQIQGLLQERGVTTNLFKKKNRTVEEMILSDVLTCFSICEYHKRKGTYPQADFFRIKNKLKLTLREFEVLLCRLGKMDYYSGIWYLRKKGGYERYLLEYCKGNKVDITKSLRFLDFLQEKSKQWNGKLTGFEADVRAEIKEKSATALTQTVFLLTYHASKGLEFDHVILPNLVEGYVPHKKNQDTEEERRMFYVAMTRAKEKLTLIAWKQEGERISILSRFMKELQT